MKKATSQDVAELAGVSQATVSLILNNSDKITFSNETKERVLAAAQKLNYRLPQRKKQREKKASNMLLVLTPTLTNQYYAELIQAIEDYADTLDYRVIVCNTFRKPDLEKFYLDTFVGAHVDGIIYTFLPSFPRLVEQISSSTPTVIIGEKLDDLSICSIELSNVNAGAMLAEHLYQLGHRKLVFISTPFNQLTLAREQRLEGIRKQLELHGVTDGLEVLVADRQAEADSQDDGLPYEYSVGRQLTAELIRRESMATALIGVNDMTALGILSELAAQGLRTGMYRARVRAMAAAHRYISPLTIPSGRRGKSRKMNRTTYKRAVQHFPNHLAPLSFLPWRSLRMPMTSMKPSFIT